MPQLDVLQTYLLVVNAASLVLHVAHGLMSSGPRRGEVNEVARNLINLAGGAYGALVPTLIWNRRVNKQSSFEHVVIASALLFWSVALCFVYRWPLNVEVFLRNLQQPRPFVYRYLAGMSCATLIVFGLDKLRAIRDGWRVPEAVLLGLSFVGGTPGGLAGMALFQHKVRAPQFTLGLPLMLVGQVGLFVLLVSIGVI